MPARLECCLAPLDIEGAVNRCDGRPPVGPDAHTDYRYARELLDARDDVSNRLGHRGVAYSLCSLVLCHLYPVFV